MIIKSFEIPLYRGNLIVIIEKEISEIKKVVTSFSSLVLYAHSYLDNFNGCQGFFIILNFKSEYRKIKHGTINHECIHIANMILGERGILADFNNDEAQAYLAEWICDNVYSVINENNYKVE